MRVYIHAGMHKTGTTSIQKVLLNNTKLLEGFGYRVLVNQLKMDARDDSNFDPLWLRYQLELAQKDGLQAFIFSAEMISTFNSMQLNALVSAFQGYDVSLIVYVRHWVNFLPSRWAQNCSRRDTQSFSAYLKKLQDGRIHIDSRFDLVIKRMIDVNPGTIKIISYDRVAALGTLLSSCIAAFDLPQRFLDASEGIGMQENTRKNINEIELTRLFNGLYSQQRGAKSNELFWSLAEFDFVKQFYDLHNKVALYLLKHQKLKVELLNLIKEKEVLIVLSRKVACISKWERLLENISRDYMVNSGGSALFGGVSVVNFLSSDIEIDDLPIKVRKEMAGMFEEV